MIENSLQRKRLNRTEKKLVLLCVYLYITVSTPHTYVSFFLRIVPLRSSLYIFIFSLCWNVYCPSLSNILWKKTKLRKNLKSNQQEEEKKNNFFNFWLQWCLFKSLYILRLAILLNLLLWFIIFNINDGDTLFLKITYYTTRTSLNRLNYIPSKTSMRYLMGHRCNCWSCHWNLFFGLSFFLEKKLEKSNEGWV